MKKNNIIFLLFLILGSCINRNEVIVNDRYDLMYQGLKNITIESLVNENSKLDQTLNKNNPNYKSIRKVTADLIGYLNELNARITTYSGGYDEYRNFTNSGNDKIINKFFLMDELDRPKESVRFEENLMSYTNYLNSLNIKSTVYYQPNEHQYWSKISGRRDESFTEVLLGNSTVIQGLLIISELQINILIEENSYYTNQLIKTIANNGE